MPSAKTHEAHACLHTGQASKSKGKESKQSKKESKKAKGDAPEKEEVLHSFKTELAFAVDEATADDEHDVRAGADAAEPVAATGYAPKDTASS